MSRPPRLLILNATCLEVIDAHRQYLDATGVAWEADPDFHSLAADQVDDVLRRADGLILPAALRNIPLAEHMQRHPAIRVLSIAASGYDWLDVDAATDNGIVVTYAPVREGVEVVADMTWALMLAVAREVPHYHQRICTGDHRRGMGVGAWRKTLGIVGLGRIGQAVARRAAGFEMRVLAAEPNADAAFVEKHGIEIVDLPTLLRESDFITLHVRLNAETRGMIGRAELALMKPTAYLINAARQELVDETALCDAIFAHRLAGAGLDDPPTTAGSPLLGLPNVVFAPHHGNRAIEGVHAVFRTAIDNAVAVLQGRRPEFVVNPQVYERGIRRVPFSGSQQS